jgi:hypothetical protein
MPSPRSRTIRTAPTNRKLNWGAYANWAQSWFDIQGRARQEGGTGTGGSAGVPAGTDWAEPLLGVAESAPRDSPQREFFEYAGALFGVIVSPAASTTPLNDARKLKVLPRDRSRRRVVEDLTFAWTLVLLAGREREFLGHSRSRR